MSILFGNILTVSVKQIIILAIISATIMTLMVIITRPLLFSSIDPTQAESKNIPNHLLSILFFLILSLTVTMACQIVGALLVFALLIGPGAIATQWCDGFYQSITTSIIISALIIWSSLTAAFYINLPVSFCITMMVSLIYCIGMIKK